MRKSIFDELSCDPKIASQDDFYTYGLRPLYYITENFFSGERIVIRRKDELIQAMGEYFCSRYVSGCSVCD
jgi:hypothetical protein